MLNYNTVFSFLGGFPLSSDGKFTVVPWLLCSFAINFFMVTVEPISIFIVTYVAVKQNPDLPFNCDTIGVRNKITI